MKAIAIVGAVLMTSASIYGITDYVQTDKKGALKAMYQDEAAAANAPVPVTTTALKTTVTKDVVKKETTKPTEKKKVLRKQRAKKSLDLKEFSRGRIIDEIPPEVLEKVPATKAATKDNSTPAVVPATVPAVPAPVTPAVKENAEPVKATTVKRLDLSKFSRAAPIRKPMPVKPKE
jgi:hypothetical protein